MPVHAERKTKVHIKADDRLRTIVQRSELPPGREGSTRPSMKLGSCQHHFWNVAMAAMAMRPQTPSIAGGLPESPMTVFLPDEAHLSPWNATWKVTPGARENAGSVALVVQVRWWVTIVRGSLLSD